MGQRNVSIRSLLDASDPKEDTPTGRSPTDSIPVDVAAPVSAAGAVYSEDPVQSLLSRYQTSVGFPEYSGPKPAAPRTEASASVPAPAPVAVAPQAIAPKTEPPTNILQNYVKKFQLAFNPAADFISYPPLVSPSPQALNSPTPLSKESLAPAKLRQLKPAFKIQPLANKHSIDSIINLDDSTAHVPKEKKRPLTKADQANKKPKTEPKKTTKPAVKPEAKKTSKAKRKTPETVIPEKLSIHPTMTTDKTQSAANVTVPAATFIESESDRILSASLSEKREGTMEVDQIIDTKEKDTKDKDTNEKDTKEKDARDNKDKEKEKGKTEKEPAVEVPVIALNIPLLDPKNPQPGQAEVVINVLKLAEDKYGWNTIHPNAKSAIDLMDDILDDDDEGEDEEEEDVSVADEKANPLKKKEELTEEQLIKRHETKMNRKVGKYDYEDPFIDDVELQWEEEITTTKEGFFVYWGPLVEEKSSSKKSTGKSKK